MRRAGPRHAARRRRIDARRRRSAAGRGRRARARARGRRLRHRPRDLTGLFGVAPDDEERARARTRAARRGRARRSWFTRGDLVTATVRRSCRHCLACSDGFPDSCLTGDYRRARDHPAERLRRRARRRGSGAARRRPAVARPARGPRRAGVDLRARAPPCRGDRRPAAVGARSARWCSARARSGRSRPTSCGCAASRSGPRRSSRRARAGDARLGATYFPPTRRDRARGDLGGFDLVRRGRRGRPVDGRDARAPAPKRRGLPARHRWPPRATSRSTGACWRRRDPREPRAVRERQRGSRGLARRPSPISRARERWPDELEQFVGLRVPLDRFEDAFAHRGGKATLVLSD